MRTRCQRYQGFTLLELIAALVLLSVIGVGAVNYIRDGAKAYVTVASRDQMTQVARATIEKISRSLRSALPGSVRVSGNCVEFVPVLASTIYLGDALQVASAITVVDFLDANSISPSRAAIYTLDASDVYSPVTSTSKLVRLAAAPIGSAVGGSRDVQFNASHQFPAESPTQRIYFINEPESYCVVGNELRRYRNYSGAQFVDPQPSPPSSPIDLLAEGVQLNDNGAMVVPFQYTVGVGRSRPLVNIDLRFQHAAAQDEWLRFSHPVYLRGVP